MMEIYKTKVKSLNISALNIYGGRWYCENGIFIDLPDDIWHLGTNYFIAQNEVSYEPLKKAITDSLMTKGKKYVFEKMSSIQFTTVYLPVVPIKIGGYVLYDANVQSKLFSYGKLSEGIIISDDILRCFNWKELDRDNISNLYKKRQIMPSDRPYASFLEIQQYYGACEIENFGMFYMPVVEMSCMIDRKEYRFSALGDANASNYSESSRIPVDQLLEKGELNISVDKYIPKFTIAVMIIGIIVAIVGVIIRYHYFPNSTVEFVVGAIMWLIIWGLAMFLLFYLSSFLELQVLTFVNFLRVVRSKILLKMAFRKKQNEAIKLGFTSAKDYKICFSADKSTGIIKAEVCLKD